MAIIIIFGEMPISVDALIAIGAMISTSAVVGTMVVHSAVSM